MKEVQSMYDQVGTYFSKTRKKQYGQKSYNWPIVQKYLDTLQAGETVLDVGCGDGRLVSGLPQGVIYLGFDFSRVLLESARMTYPERQFLYGDVCDKSVWARLQQYDAVFSIALLHHLPTRERQLELMVEMNQHVKTGGLLFLTTWNLWHEQMAQKGIERENLKAGEVIEMKFDQTPGRYVVAIDLPYLTGLLSEAGWEVLKLGYDEQNLVAIARG